MKKRRVDELLVARGLAEGLERARALVMAGQVVAGDQRVDKASQLVAPDVPLRVKGQSRFVSRGGDKLLGAVEDLELAAAFKGAVVLDVGASTGGFTQCCLELGAKHVLALDVGSNQLAWELRNDSRVTSLEQTDLRDFDPAVHAAVQIVVGDVSFNSWERLAPFVRKAAPRDDVLVLVLVKPQFELPRELVDEGGVVEDDVLRTKAVEQVKKAFAAAGLHPLRTVDARVSGRSGNREIFLYAKASKD